MLEGFVGECHAVADGRRELPATGPEISPDAGPKLESPGTV